MPPTQELVEFIDEQIERLVGILAGGVGQQIGAPDLHASLGHEEVAGPAGFVQFQIKAESHDTMFMPQQAGALVGGGLAEGGRQIEVDAAHDDGSGEVSGVGWVDMVWVRRSPAPGVGYNHGDRFKPATVRPVSGLENIHFPGMCCGMKLSIGLLLLASVSQLGAAVPATDPLEMQVGELVARPQVTVVHFWAPWCSNCRAEMSPDNGWAKFIAANPTVQVVFLNIWHKGQDPARSLAAAGLGAQPNLLLLTHPNASRLAADRLDVFLGLPVT